MCPGTIGVKNHIDPAFTVNLEVGPELTALHLAALLGNDALVQLLLKKGVDIKAKSVYLLQPETTEPNHGESVRYLLLDNGLNEIRGDLTQHNATKQKLLNKHPNKPSEAQTAEIRDEEEVARHQQFELIFEEPSGTVQHERPLSARSPAIPTPR
ncbi:hypothetical protein F5B22DRAFT_648993 [Xylaria bambusicola]|uniref:uncharacterized protein n=1 Tax=Xylaria bambusicola TaxID=326684 RepID=UPI002008B1A2|nr:uncharacterized protein F5B22DRAFT_648993 [Xylaria bambusicola]KAI0509363.1 hypothetical protein F5B22DRAFT_648993 [Xylaria bambusicola]